MSWKVINAVLGMAAVDEKFCQDLLANPVQAIRARNFELTPGEQEKLKRISAKDLAEFSQKVLILFEQED